MPPPAAACAAVVAQISQYLESLEFENEPDYGLLRSLLAQLPNSPAWPTPQPQQQQQHGAGAGKGAPNGTGMRAPPHAAPCTGF